MPPLCFAYYCSGHGYGHATRVSAFTCHLLSLPAAERPTVYITSSAPKHVFSDSIALGALYRYAEIDPIIVQPLAYRVDRQKSVGVLKSFLARKDELLDTERKWLKEINAHAVLSDAAFLGCLAAKAAGIPSILITNFTFDSVYSYLATPILQVDLEPSTQWNITPKDNFSNLVPDIPVSSAEVEPLVSHIFDGYRCADLLILLPGFIPIPSFPIYPSLPATVWVDHSTNRFHTDIIDSLLKFSQPPALHPTIHSRYFNLPTCQPIRSVYAAPLLVRSPTEEPSVYTPEGRARLLSSIGVPQELHDPANTKILIVSFGGQVFRAPSLPPSKNHSRTASPCPSPSAAAATHFIPRGVSDTNLSFQKPGALSVVPPASPLDQALPRMTTPSHIWIPGAPPASKRPTTASAVVSVFTVPQLATTPPTPSALQASFNFSALNDVIEPHLLPDDSWIAIVCGAPKGDDELPEGFYVAPRDVYMPDLTAVGDVLLGKLGYGTVSECVDSFTPFVYVSRPLFIEEHGLRLLLDREGVGVELSRQSYEAGDWGVTVEEAWIRGRDAKERKRVNARAGIGFSDKKKEGYNMAQKVISFTQEWHMV